VRTDSLRLAFARENFAKLVKTTIPQLPILAHPGVEIPKGPRAKRIEPLLPFRPHTDETSLMQDAEMPRHARLIDIDILDDVLDRMLAAPEYVYDAQPGWVSQDLKELNMHGNAYVS
jgi:hypothetical protein